MDQSCKIEEQFAASAVVSVATTDFENQDQTCCLDEADLVTTTVIHNSTPEKSPSLNSKTIKPYPYFYYRDFSTVPDPDPLVPLTAIGRMPNFPAKMHSILSRADLSHIVCWMPHGRSWKVLKPEEFEQGVIPTYFEHAKFSSFLRQANGWGFRRITRGRDRNTYYHEMFLRGLPHLCKMMKRPGVSVKRAADPKHEPDLSKISEERAVPERPADDSVLLHYTLQGGPKARMPIYQGRLSKTSSWPTATKLQSSASTAAQPQKSLQLIAPSRVVGNDHAHQMPPGISTGYGMPRSLLAHPTIPHTTYVHAHEQAHELPAPPTSYHISAHDGTKHHQYMITSVLVPNDSSVQHSPTSNPLSGMPQASIQASVAADPHFAAGFAAAVALSQQHFHRFQKNWA